MNLRTCTAVLVAAFVCVAMITAPVAARGGPAPWGSGTAEDDVDNVHPVEGAAIGLMCTGVGVVNFFAGAACAAAFGAAGAD